MNAIIWALDRFLTPRGTAVFLGGAVAVGLVIGWLTCPTTPLEADHRSTLTAA